MDRSAAMFTWGEGIYGQVCCYVYLRERDLWTGLVLGSPEVKGSMDRSAARFI